MLTFLAIIPKKILLLFCIGLILFFVLIFSFIRTPGSQETTTVPDVVSTPAIILPPDARKPVKTAITFQFGNPTFPRQANVYRVSSYGVDDNWAQTIARTFKFTNTPQSRTDGEGFKSLIWQSEDGTEVLSITLDVGYVEYSKYQNPLQPGNDQTTTDPPLPAETIIQIAQTFLESHKLYPPDVATSANNITYIISRGGEVEETDNKAQATTYRVGFSRTLERTLINQQFGTTTPISVWVERTGSVVKASYQYPLVLEDTARAFPLITLDEAKAKLIAGEGVIVNLEPGELSIKTVRDPQSIRLDKTSFRYFDDKRTGFIQPIFVFEGEATYEGNIREPVIMYLPALKK